jgi:hypothetical protein
LMSLSVRCGKPAAMVAHLYERSCKRNQFIVEAAQVCIARTPDLLVAVSFVEFLD